MITRTVIYRDTNFDHLGASIDHMAEEAAWAVRCIEVLEPIHSIHVEATRQPPVMEHTKRVLTVLVVYERARGT